MEGLFTGTSSSSPSGGNGKQNKGNSEPEGLAVNEAESSAEQTVSHQSDVPSAGGATDSAGLTKGDGIHAAAKVSAATVAVWVRDIAITVFALLILFIIHMLYVTDAQNASVQRNLSNQLADSWAQPAPHKENQVKTKKVPLTYTSDIKEGFGDGQPMMQLRIPALGVTNTVVHGVSQWDLAQGSGYYPDSALPGERGNVAIAGHRIGKGAPFNKLDKLNTCDDIVVETEKKIYTYKVLGMDGSVPNCIPTEVRHSMKGYPGVKGRTIVDPTEVGVVDPVPHMMDSTPDAEATAPLITLTTCHPEYGNTERLIIHAALATEEEKIV